MTGGEILKKIKEMKTPEQCVIKWWRNEEDFIDFELIDQFESNVGKDEEIAGFELVDLDQLWTHVKVLCGDRLKKDRKDGEDLLLWSREGGKMHRRPYTAKSLLEILDIETKGNYVD
jgi:hypothetical protein